VKGKPLQQMMWDTSENFRTIITKKKCTDSLNTLLRVEKSVPYNEEGLSKVKCSVNKHLVRLHESISY